MATERLVLRGWNLEDRAVFHAHCSDPLVMQHLGSLMTLEEVDAALARQEAFRQRHGYCFWAVERTADKLLLGFCGLKPGAEGTPIEGEVEIGWRFGAEHWGKGYAREAAGASLDWGWINLPAQQIYAITTPGNRRSWTLMERLGMKRRYDMDFDHPTAADHLRAHVTYVAERP